MKPHKYTPDSLVEIDTISFTPPVRALHVSAFERPLLGCQKENIVVVSTLPDHMPGSFGSIATLGDVDGVTRSNMARNRQPKEEQRAGIIRGDPT